VEGKGGKRYRVGTAKLGRDKLGRVGQIKGVGQKDVEIGGVFSDWQLYHTRDSVL
jgi:hypothetical protein